MVKADYMDVKKQGSFLGNYLKFKSKEELQVRNFEYFVKDRGQVCGMFDQMINDTCSCCNYTVSHLMRIH